MSFQHLSVDELKAMLEAHAPVLLDIRDDASYEAGHIAGSLCLNQHSVADIVNDTDKTSTVVVVCYHGHSSQGAANYLVEQGFRDVYSLDGGYTAWASSAQR